MNDFDIKANDWDKNKINFERAKAIAAYIEPLVPADKKPKAMELGAGTGLLSFVLHDAFTSVTLIDSSKEMIRICNEKIVTTGTDHFKAIQLDLETEDINDTFDVVYSQMAFHHLTDIPNIMHKIFSLLNPGGIIAVADLYEEDGSFHGEGFTGYKGFEPEWLSDLLAIAGFRDITYQTCYIQKKQDVDGAIRDYPVFLLSGQKS